VELTGLNGKNTEHTFILALLKLSSEYYRKIHAALPAIGTVR
jgi:hypothetical protein